MIKLEKIDKVFGEHQVLSSVDLTLAPGSVTALIGPSGSGKSTLLRCVNLLEIPDERSRCEPVRPENVDNRGNVVFVDRLPAVRQRSRVRQG